MTLRSRIHVIYMSITLEYTGALLSSVHAYWLAELLLKLGKVGTLEFSWLSYLPRYSFPPDKL
jgi:hypothetical protein